MEEMAMETSREKNSVDRNPCRRRKRHDDCDYDDDALSQYLSLWRTIATDDEADNKTLSMLKSKGTATDDEADYKTWSLDSNYSPDQHKPRRLGAHLFENFKPKKSKVSYENEVKALAELALAQHNKDKSAHYEYVRSGPVNPVKSGSRRWDHKHMNFFAKLKGTDASPDLFFAVVKSGEEVVHCCILNPKPCSDGDTQQERRVYHCKDVECRKCAFFESRRSGNCGMIFV